MRSTRYRHLSRGFTLIEVLVVVVILGLVVATLLPKLGSLGDDRDLEREARRFAALYELAAEEAAMQGRELGIRFGIDDYAFYDLDPDTGAWVELTGDDLLRPRTLAEDVTVDLWLEDRLIQLDPDATSLSDQPEEPEDGSDEQSVKIGNPPHVSILSSGETTEFQLRMSRRFDSSELTLLGDAFGGIVIERDNFQ